LRDREKEIEGKERLREESGAESDSKSDKREEK